MPAEIQGRFNQNLSSVATSPSGLIITKYTSLPFDKVKIFAKKGELIKELDLPSGNYEANWEDDINKLIVTGNFFDKPTTTYSIDADNSDF
jgi:hypothetical protein